MPHETVDVARAALRRSPRQDRSAQRIESILDATAALIDEVGYGNVSPTLIAKRVGMSGPGIYRYFDGMTAIAAALATRNLTRLMQVSHDALESRDAEWQELLGRVIAAYCTLYETEPGFRWLRLGDAIDRNLIDNNDSNRTVLAHQLGELFFERFEVSRKRPDLLKHVEVVIEIVDTLTAKAFETDPTGDQFFIDECTRLAIGYLEEYLVRTQSYLDD
ncbi:TetR family transcriptional regulator [Agreia pratensis]|uniref:Transcriptional regulator, TetR family n=1 Tax=Agreia pratensis TaxID=150121 RepID=A0A1X7KPG2_9MICO|nr:TetR/AcrR family transcriptional regulator [Agreia pratensis]MBF4635672.1 TetR family transcriptional regulator [Agreia pratensis]SMG43430.1 transcriptional regulator, TetR family [Agreia pratensis]